MIKKKIGKILRAFITNTPWFKNQFLDCGKFWQQKEFDIDVAFIGTDSGHYAFSASSTSGKSADWTLRDSTILQCYEVLRNYSSYLNPGYSKVILVISPFDFLTGSTLYFEDRYYSILNMASIPGFAYERRLDVLARRNNPIMYYPLFPLKKDLLALLKKNNDICITTADGYINHIKHRYAIRKFDDNKLSLLNQDAFIDSVSILSRMKGFADSHNIELILSFPPMPKPMIEQTSLFMANPFFESMLKEIQDIGITIRNYAIEHDFNNDLFSSELYLNKDGAKEFTKLILE